MIEVRQHVFDRPELVLIVVDHDDILDDQTLDVGGRRLLSAAHAARTAPADRGQRHESNRADAGREDRLDERGCVRG